MKTKIAFFVLTFCALFIQLNAQIISEKSFNGSFSSGGGSFISLGPEGVQIIDMVVYPSNSNIMYAAIDERERNDCIYKTTDGGETWSFLTELPGTNINIYCMDIDPKSSNTLYVGTNRGIYKGSNTFRSLVMSYGSVYCYGIKINRKYSNIIYGYGSHNGKFSFFKSRDSGATWSITQIETLHSWMRHNKNHFIIDKSDYQSIYISTFYQEGFQFHTSVFRSTNSGTSWDRFEVGSVIPSGDIVQSMDMDALGNLVMCLSDSGIYKSTNAGETWAQLSDTPKNLYSLKCLHDNPDVIVGGGTDTVFVSTDGGMTWNHSSAGLSGEAIETLFLNSSSDFVLGNSLGIFKSTDLGQTWELKINGFESRQNINSIDVSKSNPDIIYVSVYKNSDNTYYLYKSTNAGTDWNKLTSITDLRLIEIDENSPDIVYASYIPVRGIIKNTLYKTTDGGVSWQDVRTLDNAIITDIVKQENTLLIIYVDGNTNSTEIARSMDGGENWTDTEITQNLLNRSTLEIDHFNQNILYVCGYFYEDRRYYRASLHKSTDGGDSWNVMYRPYTGTFAFSIAAAPLTPNTLYFGSRNGIFKSIDGGVSYEKVNSDSCRALYIDKNGVIYGGCESKVIVSSNGGSSWLSYSEGMNSRVNSNCLLVDETNKILYAGTESQGVISLNLSDITRIAQDTEKEISGYKLYNNYPNPFNHETVIRYQVSGIRDRGLGVRGQGIGLTCVKLEIYNTLGQLVTTLINEEKQPGEYKVLWNGKNLSGNDVPSGVYLYRLQAGEFSDVKKMILVK